MVELFQRNQSVISRNVRNVFKEGELEERGNMQKMHIPKAEASSLFGQESHFRFGRTKLINFVPEHCFSMLLPVP
jgi:hypothetical protein